MKTYSNKTSAQINTHLDDEHIGYLRILEEHYRMRGNRSELLRVIIKSQADKIVNDFKIGVKS